MKRIVLSIVVLLVLLCGIAVAEGTTIVAEGNCGTNVKWTLDSEGTLTISGEGTMHNYDHWGSNYAPWYSNRESIKTVVIESGVTSIGEFAFHNCSSLSSITIPDGVTSIGNRAFEYCSSLSSITIPEGVTSIGDCAFYECSNLSSITIPKGVTSIGDGAFSECRSLSSITIPEGVTSIGNSAFSWCNSLSSITISEGVTSIGSSAFSRCSSLSSITIPKGVTSIGNSAFSECSSLSSITIPETVNTIGSSAFSSCPELKQFNVVEGSYAYRWLTVNGYLGDYVAKGTCGDKGMNLIWTLDSAGTLTIKGEGMMQDYTWGGSVPWYSKCTTIKTAVIEEGVTSIGDRAFRECSNLSSITIPDDVTSIGEYAFQYCSSLRSITIPDGVTSIGDGAFRNCSSLSSITIPKDVTSIGGSAFYGCSSLSSITIPEGVTSIGDSAFEGCSSLRSITIPDGVTSIDACAFYGCSSLGSITIPEGVTSIGDSAFRGCSSLSSITIPEGVTSIGNWTFSRCSSLSSITLPDGVTSIGDSAFYQCSSLRKVMFLGNDMPTLGSSVFSTRPTIYCYEFSGVDFWAAEEGYTCVYIDNMDLSRPISISLPQDMRIEVGESRTISAVLFPQTATAEIVWQSSDPSVVSVENGVLTALAIGEATITASCGDASDRMNVTVYAPVESFELSETELWVVSKQSAQLDICYIEPAGATAVFTWESSDTSVLTVDGGKITALKPGDATVTVTSDSGIVRSCLVHVCYPVTAIELEQSKYQLTVGDEAQITANVSTRDQSCVNRLVKFESSDEAVATVDASGRIHAVSAGTAIITVAAASGINTSCTVEVANHPHTPVTDPAVPATHVTTGLTEGSHCAVCGEVLVAQQIIPIVEVEKLVFPAELEVIEAEAFAGGTFACVVLPEGCKEIGAGAFKDCAQLRFIEIPRSVEYIDGSAFAGCSDSLIIVTVPSSAALCFAQEKGITYVLR